MNLFRKIFLLFITFLLYQSAGAQKKYPDLKQRYSYEQIDSLRKVYEALDDAKGLGIVYELEGIFYQNIYNYSSSTIGSFFISSQNYFKIKDFWAYYRVRKRIADMYAVDDAMYDRAVEFYRQALGYFQDRNNKALVASYTLDLLNIAINKDSLLQKLNRKIFPDTEKALKSTIDTCRKLKNQHYLASAYNLYGAFLLQQNELDQAEEYTQLSKTLSKSQIQLEMLNLLQLAVIKKMKNQLPEAIVLLKESELMADLRNNKYLMQRICRCLAECYTMQKDIPNAISYWKKTADAIYRFHNSGVTQMTRNEFTRDQLYTARVERALVKQQQRNWFIFFTSLIVIMLLVGVIVFLINKARNRQKDLISQRKFSELELKSMKSLIEGQEKERNRVAKDLHDGLGAHLSSIKLFVESQRDKFDSTVQETLITPIAKNIDHACLETRSISHDLRPFSLKYGFNSALGDLVKKSQNALPNTEVIFDSYGEEPHISEEIALMVYRVVQELLNNAAKYAKASQITVQIFYEPEQISVHVEDDGQGFDLKQVKEGNGLGNIRSRIDYLGGQVIWQAAPQQGTAVILSVPLHNYSKTLG